MTRLADTVRLTAHTDVAAPLPTNTAAQYLWGKYNTEGKVIDSSLDMICLPPGNHFSYIRAKQPCNKTTRQMKYMFHVNNNNKNIIHIRIFTSFF